MQSVTKDFVSPVSSIMRQTYTGMSVSGHQHCHFVLQSEYRMVQKEVI